MRKRVQANLNNTLHSLWSCLYSTVQLPGASMALEEVSLTLLEKQRKDRYLDTQEHSGVYRGAQLKMGFIVGLRVAPLLIYAN